MGRFQDPIKKERQNNGIGKIEENKGIGINRAEEKVRSSSRSWSDSRPNKVEGDWEIEAKIRTGKRSANISAENEINGKIRKEKSRGMICCYAEKKVRAA